MDMETKRDMETMAEWAATQDAWDRLLERRERRRRSLRFWFSWRQVVDGPDVPVPSPGDHTRIPRVSAPPGLGSGAAGSIRRTPASGPTLGLVSGSPVPGRPTHSPCSEASRISAALNRHT